MPSLTEFPLVTIGVASYNNANYIEETLDSINRQDYPNWELIIVDDKSTDNSVDVIKGWIKRNSMLPVRLITNELNQGVCKVLNLIIKEAQGLFLSTIGSDDIYLPNKLSIQVQAFQNLNENYAMCYSDIVRINKHGELLDGGRPVSSPQGTPEGEIFNSLLIGNFIPAMTQLTRLSVFRELGGFDESLTYEDWDMWLRIARQYRIKYVPGVVAQYRIHGRSAMTTRIQALIESTLQLLSKHIGISSDTDKIVQTKMAKLAQELYVAGSPKAESWLRLSWQWHPNLRTASFIAFSALGINYQGLARVWGKVRWINASKNK